MFAAREKTLGDLPAQRSLQATEEPVLQRPEMVFYQAGPRLVLDQHHS